MTTDQIASWTERLTRIRARPLTFCPDFPAIASRWEAWWRRESDRPLLVAGAAKTDAVRWGKAFDLLERPEEWLAVRRRQVENTHYVGETIPHIRVDIGPVSTAAYLGAPLTLSESEQTTWQTPIIEDWDSPPSLALDPDNRWFTLVADLVSVTARDAAGDYLVCMPDLAGAIDTLSNLRGPDRLCMDLLESRQQVIEAAARVTDAWETCFRMLYDRTIREGAGVINWLGAWSDCPYAIPTCDFNFMISPRDFVEVCLPSLTEQALRAGRCLIHQDGPGASRHAWALAASAAITAVQYTPGAGSRSALAKREMLHMLQDAGKPILVICPREEIPALIDQLDPRGLALMPDDITSPRQADEALRAVHAPFP